MHVLRTAVLRLALIFVFTIPWEGVVEFTQIGTITRTLGFALAGLWVVMVFVQGEMRRLSSFHVAVAVFVLWNLLSVFWSDDPRSTFDRADTWVQLLGLTLILWDLLRTRQAVARALQAFVLGEYVSLAGALSNFAAGDAFYTTYQRFSPGDTNPDGFGVTLALGIPMAWYLASNSRLPIAESPRLNRVLRLVNYIYIPAGFIGIALSGTRTAAIAAGLGMVYGFSQLTQLNSRQRTWVLLGLTAVFLIVLPFIAPLRSFQRLGTTGNEITEGDLNGRLTNWSEGLAAFPERPILGVGSNMYRSINPLGKLAHNSFLSVLVELGLIGFVFFGVVLLSVFRVVLLEPKWDRWFWMTLLATWAIGASTLTWEHRKPTWVILTLAVASAASVVRAADRAEPVKAEIVPVT